MKARLIDLLSFLGLRDAPRAADQPAAPIELRLILAVHDERILVGKLRKEDREFVFEYAPDFDSRRIPPLPDFPDTRKLYRSETLWPFFLARLPPSDRSDVIDVLKDQQIEPQNKLEILGRLSRHTATSPYEIELAKAS